LVFPIISALTHELRRYFRGPTIGPVNIKERQQLTWNGVRTVDVLFLAGAAEDRSIMEKTTPYFLQGLNNACAA